MKICSLETIDFTLVSHNSRIKKQVMLKNGELGCITNFSKASFPVGEMAPMHQHEDMGEVFLIESGEGLIRVNDTEYRLSSGMCITVEAGERHEIVNTGRVELVVIYFGVKVDDVKGKVRQG